VRGRVLSSCVIKLTRFSTINWPKS
jgi:hypothetical protein